MLRSTVLHLRIPFSFFLLPVFLFALALSDNVQWVELVLVFFILHLFLYPASNGYNSYFDRDEESIGGLRNPPKVTRQLYFVSLTLDFIALILGIGVSWSFVLMLVIYGLVSKAYSYPGVRLKKYPILGWLVAGFFQGFFTWMMVYQAINQAPWSQLFQTKLISAAALSTMLLWGSYPMTQVYQHREDSRRGDRTLSLMLGVKGTFYFTALAFGLANAGFLVFFGTYYDMTISWAFQAFLVPILLYFLWWFKKVLKDPNQANYEHTMRLNLISALFLNCFFLGLFLFQL